MAARPRIIDRLASAVARIFYRVDVAGAVPESGPVLLLPNHPNALLDPALVMATAGRPVRFLAKSTLFKGPFSPLLRAADAIPVYRRQDGADVARNEETFADVHTALARGEAVCIFPEGISHSSGRLEPLRTGAARMALSAQAAGIDVPLVAVGINLEKKTTFRSRATVAYGQPFTLPRSSESSGDHVRSVTARIAGHIRSVLVEADPRTDAWIVERVDRLYRSERTVDDDAHATLARKRAIADTLRRLRAERPDWYANAVVEFRRYDDRLRRFRLHDRALDWNASSSEARAFVQREVPFALVLGPLAALALLLFVVPYCLTAIASRVVKEMDVTATAKVVAGAVIYSVWTLCLIATAWWLSGPLAGLAALLGIPALAIAGLFAIERETSAWRTARSWLALRGARPRTRAALRRRRAELADVLERIKGEMDETANYELRTPNRSR
ncbi:MAG TPA: lysophospholipid acyltransferase family protein [Vicinamibacterales bacterium]